MSGLIRRPRPLDGAARRRLERSARSVRTDVLRMIHNAGSGNPGSALSCTDILVWLLLHEMHVTAGEPRRPDRDRLVLSKGHAAPVFYSVATELGWVDREELLGFRRFGTRLQTHPEYGTLPAVDFTSGSLGQGLSAAAGMALAARYLGLDAPRFFVLLGDGEIQEGQVWEAAMTAGHYGLGSLVAVLDRNGFQGDRDTRSLMDIEPLDDKWRAFGWDVAETDGHDFERLYEALAALADDRPGLIVARTVKGKGVSFMEHDNAWHVGGPKFTDERLERALSEVAAEQVGAGA